MKLVRLLAVSATLLALGVTFSRAEGWSLWPAGNNDDSKTQTVHTVAQTTTSTPSTWDKLVSGTKKLFGGGTSSQPTTTRKVATSPYTPKQQKKSWWDSTFGPKEQPKQKMTTGEWLAQKRVGEVGQ